jgi:hypothetical protein
MGRKRKDRQRRGGSCDGPEQARARWDGRTTMSVKGALPLEACQYM